MPIAQAKGPAAVLVVACLTAAALPLAQAAVTVVKPVVPPRPISIIMLAKPRPPAPDAAKISAWIHDLALGNAADQTRARELLVATGDAALPALKKALHKPPTAAAHQRLRAALDAIYTADALRGPLVSVRARNASLKSIIGVVCNEADFSADFPQPRHLAAQRPTIDVQRQPFWKVLQRIAGATGVSPVGGDATWALLDFGHGVFFTNGAPVAINGAFALVIQSTRQITVYGSQQTTGQGHRELIVKYCGLWIPTSHAFVQICSPVVRLAVDEKGRILATSERIKCHFFGADNGRSLEFGFPYKITLNRASTAARFIARLRMRVPVVISTGPNPQKTGSLAIGGQIIRYAGISLNFGEPTAKGSGWMVSMALKEPSTTGSSLRVRALLCHTINSLGSPLTFETASGRLLPYQVEYKSAKGSVTRYECFFRHGKPATAHLKVYRHTTTTALLFKFKNVPLPP